MLPETYALYEEPTLFDRLVAKCRRWLLDRLPADTELRWALLLAAFGMLLGVCGVLGLIRLAVADLPWNQELAQLLAATLLLAGGHHLLGAAETAARQRARPAPVPQRLRAVPPPAAEAAAECRAFFALLREAGINVRIARALFDAGVRRPQQVRALDDAALLAIRGVGPATLRKLRQQFS
ncbi:helix-hairpin-helix domain-containing protein [Thiohalobacter sp. IOR34]|uniref:helix-hairpin-helix domain-containing protein n=1 Tax=Thiohalobacter sp. IOR34 TaxID=3057176 RepID=UPI0025B132C2|nr:helix-hairpin-helix domain-containing protein [Thiohalobacter sp. IOR34]WJW76114.1 helix-hairpin-helix domain-containing protein [Thiohalobacter sp. IOR34]